MKFLSPTRWKKSTLVLVCTVVVACAGGGLNLFPVSDDAKLGQQVDKEIRSNPKEYPILNNAEVRSYVQGIVDEITRSPEVRFRDRFAYKVEIINDSKTVNAFCTPGGYIYVYTGLMKFVDNEATLAGVLGHEVAHAELRHSTQRMTKAYGAQLLSGILLGNNPSQLSQMGANLFTGLALLNNSRSDEMESDNASFKYLRSTRWYPGGIKYFFEKTSAKTGGRTSTLDKLFMTHPPSEERYSNINKLLTDNKIPTPTESNLRAEAFRKIVAKLP